MPILERNKHRLNAADIITFLRIAGTILIVALKPLSADFFCVYALTGMTDMLDGWIARKTKTASDFGARLDSIADLLFYAVILIRILPILLVKLPNEIWYAVAIILCLRILAYITAAIKYRLFASLHTYLNKFTGFLVFLIPVFLITDYAVVFCWIASAVAMAASLEELVIHLRSNVYCSNVKSILVNYK
ncbi:MAG: CDP-alcohol phosphatidyltransferase family protein [Lachnospiraceae bacterium]